MKKIHKRIMAVTAICIMIAFTVAIITKSQSGVEKVQVCHFGQNELVIGEPAVQSHLDHGDCVGPCPCE